MALTNDQITAQNFKDFYEQIRPYLNGQVPTFANQFSRSDLYSTDEKIIGQWIDGKPLYQKTFSGTVSSANNISYVSIGASVDTVVDGRGILNNSVPLIGVTNESVSAGVSIFVNTNSAASNKNTFGVYSKPESQSAWVGSPYYFTLCYTKTTDSAIKVGTGTDYSTEEQVIGTWIDGKPLYQKTIDMGAVPSGAQNGYNMTTGLTNVDTYFVVNHFSQNGCQLPYIIGTGDHGRNVAGLWYMDNTNKTPKYQLYTSSDRSGFGHLYATLRYTKTTD